MNEYKKKLLQITKLRTSRLRVVQTRRLPCGAYIQVNVNPLEWLSEYKTVPLLNLYFKYKRCTFHISSLKKITLEIFSSREALKGLGYSKPGIPVYQVPDNILKTKKMLWNNVM